MESVIEAPRFLTTHIQRPFTNQEKNAAEECLEDVKGLIIDTVQRHLPGNMDKDEAIADGFYHYLRAFESHSRRAPDMPFHRWVRYCVRSGTIDAVKQRARRHLSAPMEYIEGDVIEDYRTSMDKVTELLNELGDDARLVAKLTLEAPAELARVANERGGTPRNLRSALRDYLRDLGWAAARINETFEEIRTVMDNS